MKAEVIVDLIVKKRMKFLNNRDLKISRSCINDIFLIFYSIGQKEESKYFKKLWFINPLIIGEENDYSPQESIEKSFDKSPQKPQH